MGGGLWVLHRDYIAPELLVAYCLAVGLAVRWAAEIIICRVGRRWRGDA